MKTVPNRLPKTPEVIEVDPQKHRYIGCGCFSKVYKLSPRRVVKVFFSRIPKYVISSEIKGSKCSEHALPVLKAVKVKIDGEQRWGLIKKYVPYGCSREEANDMYNLLSNSEQSEEAQILSEDCHRENIRKDSKGKLWMIDTQLKIPSQYV